MYKVNHLKYGSFATVVKCLLVMLFFFTTEQSHEFLSQSLDIAAVLYTCLVAVHWSILQPLLISAGRSSAPVSGFIRNYRWSSNYFEVIIPFVLSLTDFTVKLDYKTGIESIIIFTERYQKQHYQFFLDVSVFVYQSISKK